MFNVQQRPGHGRRHTSERPASRPGSASSGSARFGSALRTSSPPGARWRARYGRGWLVGWLYKTKNPMVLVIMSIDDVDFLVVIESEVQKLIFCETGNGFYQRTNRAR